MDDKEHPSMNMNREVWRQDMHDPIDLGNYYAPSVFVVGESAIGIDVGGRVNVRDVREWAAMPDELARLRAALAEAERDEARHEVEVRDHIYSEAAKSFVKLASAQIEIERLNRTQEATDLALIDEIRKHNRDRRTIRALVVVARAMWRCHMEMAYIDSSVGDYVQWISEKVCEVENEQSERGQAGKE